MSKVAPLARNALKNRLSLLHPVIRVPARSFCSAGEQQGPPAEGEPPIDPFLEPPIGEVYGRLSGFGRCTLKTDIIHFLEGCNLSKSDLKFEYSNTFVPNSVMLRFSSQSSFETALRQTIRKGRLYKLEKTNSDRWDITESHDGRTVLVQGLPRNTAREDVERFLSGCNYDSSSFRFISAPGTQYSLKAAALRVASALEATNIQLRKNSSLCMNAPVTIRVLQ